MNAEISDGVLPVKVRGWGIRPDRRGKFERVAGADGDRHVGVARQRVDDEIPVGGERVQARFHEMFRTERREPARKSSRARHDSRIGFERARVGVDRHPRRLA